MEDKLKLIRKTAINPNFKSINLNSLSLSPSFSCCQPPNPIKIETFFLSCTTYYSQPCKFAKSPSSAHKNLSLPFLLQKLGLGMKEREKPNKEAKKRS